MAEDGKPIVTDLPPVGPSTTRYHTDAEAIAARRNPGKAVLVATDAPLSMAKAIRLRTRQPYVDKTGRIIVSTRNSYTGPDGKVRCDIYFSWEKNRRGT